MTFTLTSPTLTDNATLPLAHVHTDAGGQNHSPELHWANPPAGTKSFALSCYDPDAPTGSGFWHWYIINLPGDARSLGENAAASGLPAGARHARNDYGDYTSGGACPPRPATAHTATSSPSTLSTVNTSTCPKTPLPPASALTSGHTAWAAPA